MNSPFPLPAPAGVVPLTQWGVIRARGVDAVSFLQGQLTNDVAGLPADAARLAGFCSAKGRLQASFIVWKDGDGDVLLACAASVLPATLKRLSMFVLRAKCKLSDATAELPLWGRAGPGVAGGLAVWQKGVIDGVAGLRLPDAAGQPRAMLLASPADAPALSPEAWHWLEVQSGVATIGAATVDRFVPQMLNYELLGGVDFRKGCYPGQEVVARSQYRGTVKRRTFLFDVEGVAAAGDELWHSADPGQPAGLVVDAAAVPGGGATSSLLAEVKLAALREGSLHLRAADGPALRQRDLPYPVSLELTEPA